ncbi:MAG: cache domain-containing protein [Candidatus Kariarchaeaceae archaeon]|jgi:HAMP domain-containing protein
MLEKFTLRSQILISFIVLSTISLLVISILNVGNISILGDRTRSLTTDSLEDQITRNMNMSGTENSLIIERKIQKLISVVESIAFTTESLFEDPSSLGFTTSYFDYDESTIPQDAIESPLYNNKPVSYNHSTYYITGSNPTNIATLLTPQVSDIINRSAHLDRYFSSQFSTSDNFYWLYIGFQKENVFRAFPGTIWDEDRDYNHNNRFWYNDAIDATGDMIITNPYRGVISDKWMITIARALYYEDGSILGVAAGDVLIGDIQEKVLSISFLTSGYATLFIDNDLVVAHPNWAYKSASNPIDITEVEELSPAIIQKIKQSETSEVEAIVKNGEDFFLSHSKILDRYFLLILVPREEAIEAVKAIDAQISDSQSQVTTSTILLSILTLLVVLGVGLWVANIVTKPITRLTDLASRISSNVTDDDILHGVSLDMELDRDDEVGNLTKAFSNMVQHLRDEQQSKKGDK